MSYINGLVSVIIPTYKRPDTVVRAVESVLSQTYKNIECIVVNDNEKNDAYSMELYDVLRPFTDGYKIVLLEQEHHINGAAARNCGIKNAKGEFVAFLDDDDWWEEDKIAKQVDFIRKQSDDCGAVSTLATYYKGDEVIRKTTAYKDGKIYVPIMAREFDVITCSLLVKRTALDETGYFDEKLKRHQEIQLLAYLTERYSLKLLPEHLTCVCIDDSINRPNADVLVQRKLEFFESVKPVLDRMRKTDRRYVLYMHKIELAYIYLKEKKYIKVFSECLKLLLCPRALIHSAKRIAVRTREAKFSHN